MDKVYELQHYEQIMDLNQILPNYTDFVQFINEMKQQIPNEFSKEQKWNYKTIYDKILNLYTTKKMQELTQSKSKEKEYKAVAEHILKQYKLVTNEEKFNEINEIDIKLNSRLSSKQQEKEKESNNKLKINENKQTLESEKNNLLKRNVIIKFFKRRQIKKLTAEITELEQSIQNSDLVLDKLTAEITELNNKIKSNKEELVKSCGINLSDYRTIMMQCKEENLTKEKLIEKYKNIQLMIDSLNIQEKEQYLISLCERNGLEMKSFEEQQLTWSER